jgi:hypothetical protein
MKYEEMFAFLLSKDGVSIEYPSLCGYSDKGKSKGNCKNHGHLALSVTPETANEIALLETSVPILITVPKSIWNELKEKIKSGAKE